MAQKVEDLLKYDEFKNMRFTLTQDMQDTLIEMLIIQQMLNENENLSYKEMKLLKKQKDKLLKNFITEFQANNVEKVAIFRAFLDM